MLKDCGFMSRVLGFGLKLLSWMMRKWSLLLEFLEFHLLHFWRWNSSKYFHTLSIYRCLDCKTFDDCALWSRLAKFKGEASISYWLHEWWPELSEPVTSLCLHAKRTFGYKGRHTDVICRKIQLESLNTCSNNACKMRIFKMDEWWLTIL